jgi:hypothetical protein
MKLRFKSENVFTGSLRFSLKEIEQRSLMLIF